MHPFLLAVNFHYMFVRIHPFRDGNGRTARLLSNFFLLQHGFPPIIVPVKQKERYMDSLRKWNIGDSQPFAAHMAELLQESFNLYFSLLKI
jgi:Fic family protein